MDGRLSRMGGAKHGGAGSSGNGMVAAAPTGLPGSPTSLPGEPSRVQ
ncbi:hypothetical protein ACFV5J_27730 [Streptomyces zaomyceticus]